MEDNLFRLAASYGESPATIHGREGLPVDRDTVTRRAAHDRRTIHVHDLAAEGSEYPVGSRHANCDLAERKATIRRLVEANIIGIFITGLKARVLEANDAFLRLVAHDEKEFFRKDGRRVPELFGGALFEEGNESVVSAELSCGCMLSLRTIVVAGRGVRLDPRLTAIELYQGFVWPSKSIRRPTSFVVANLTRPQLPRLPADGRHIGRRKSVNLADTCLAPQ